MTKLFIGVIFIILLVEPEYFAQEISNNYIVISSSAILFKGPGDNYEKIQKLKEGDVLKSISLIDQSWLYTEYGNDTGYVSMNNIAEIDLNDFLGWEKIRLSSGDRPDCYNFRPEVDTTIDNYLKVNVGSNTDVVIKLINIKTKKCIRYVYIHSGEINYLRNIPEGIYSLKIGYGKEWRQKIENNQCTGKFMVNAQYEKGKEILDFNLIKSGDYIQIPYYELSLDVIRTKGNEFRTNKINETEFNK